MQAKIRTIFHLDMDAFYASIEQRDCCEYRGKPVIVGANPKGGRGRGVVTAASYEARSFGIHSAMPIGKAYRLCPDGIYLCGDMKKYVQESRRIMSILSSYTDLIEPISIDEAFLDLSKLCRIEKGYELAIEIKDRIWRAENLCASIGIAPNKFLAKVASDLEKPNGLVVVLPGEEESFLSDLPIERLWGVGPKLADRFHKRGLHKIADLRQLGPSQLQFGKLGGRVAELARGIDQSEVLSGKDVKSIGREHTFMVDTADKGVIRETLLELSDVVAGRLRQHELVAQTITLKFRDENFITETRSKTLLHPVDDGREIFQRIQGLLKRIETRGRSVRLLGVSVSRLGTCDTAEMQLSLFRHSRGDEKRKLLNSAIDQIGDRFGDQAITRASFMHSNRPDSSAVGRGKLRIQAIPLAGSARSKS